MSEGVSYNKLLAKMASDQNKPNGQFVITPCLGQACVEALPVNKFHGVGPATAAKMQGLRIENGADLKAKSLSFLQQHFGKSGSWYYRIARGIDERPRSRPTTKVSRGEEDTFATDIFESDAARAQLMLLIAKVWRHCEANSMHRRPVTLAVHGLLRSYCEPPSARSSNPDHISA